MEAQDLQDQIHYLIKKREGVGLKHCNDSNVFIEYSNDKDNTDENVEDYNPNNEHKVLIVFDDMVTDMLTHKKLQ